MFCIGSTERWTWPRAYYPTFSGSSSLYVFLASLLCRHSLLFSHHVPNRQPDTSFLLGWNINSLLTFKPTNLFPRSRGPILVASVTNHSTSFMFGENLIANWTKEEDTLWVTCLFSNSRCRWFLSRGHWKFYYISPPWLSLPGLIIFSSQWWSSCNQKTFWRKRVSKVDIFLWLGVWNKWT